MSKDNINMRGSSFAEPEDYEEKRNGPFFGAGLGEATNVHLEILRANSPFETLSAMDFGWILKGENHFSTFKEFIDGMFTLRIHSNNKAETVYRSMERGCTHGVFLWSHARADDERKEVIRAAYWVDLAMAVRYIHLGEERVNKSDRNRFVIFDVSMPGVRLFTHLLRIPYLN